MPKVYDCFTFYNELDLLEVRLHELASVVDEFVLVEATKTFSNKPKPLFFQENKDRFKDFKIRHVIVDDMPDGNDPWKREIFQRNAIARGIPAGNTDDIIIISDLDEITRATVVSMLQTHDFLTVALSMYASYYKVNWSLKPSCSAVAVRRSYLDRIDPATPDDLNAHATPHDARAKNMTFNKIENAGWHFSYMGDVNWIINKLKSFSHMEYDRPPFTDPKFIEKCISHGGHLFGFEQSQFIENPDVPAYMLENKTRFSSWFVTSKKKSNTTAPLPLLTTKTVYPDYERTASPSPATTKRVVRRRRGPLMLNHRRPKR